MIERKKILILGNGFDLAHFLPTKYEHFITAMCAVEEAPSNKPLSFDNIFHELLVGEDFFLNKTKEIYKTEEVKISIENLIILKKKLSNNGWFQYFKDYLDSGIDTWIDFENEINNVLNIVCAILSKNSDINEIIDKNYYKKGVNIIDESFFEKFNVNKRHYINVLLKFNILSETYIVYNRDGFLEVEKDEFDGVIVRGFFEQTAINNGIHSKSKKIRLEKSFIKKYKGEMTGIHAYRVIGNMNKHLSCFIDIFSIYIKLVGSLMPRTDLKKPKLFIGLKSIYSFNYSSTTSRLYNREHKNFLHGKAGAGNIVLGVSELENQLLIDEKAYGFVKYYQKLVNNTDYQFLLGNYDLIKLEQDEIRNTAFGTAKPFEIYIWGHSLDSSDSDYIKEIFSFNKGVNPSVYLIIYYFPSPHAQLANLISIMGKDIIEMWMKKGWLEFIEAPDIYALNNTEGYVDKLSKYSEEDSFT